MASNGYSMIESQIVICINAYREFARKMYQHNQLIKGQIILDERTSSRDQNELSRAYIHWESYTELVTEKLMTIRFLQYWGRIKETSTSSSSKTELKDVKKQVDFKVFLERAYTVIEKSCSSYYFKIRWPKGWTNRCKFVQVIIMRDGFCSLDYLYIQW